MCWWKIGDSFLLMTQSFDLLSLPANVFSEVSSFVGSLREFVRLDSAFCHHYLRETWLHVLCAKQFTLQCEVDISDSIKLSWVLQKRLQCSSVKFSLDIEAYGRVSDFFRETGPSVRKVYFVGGTKAHEMMIVALYCTNLTGLHVRKLALTCAMREIMLRNPNLQVIRCWKVKCSESDVFAGVNLHKLTKFYVKSADCVGGFPWHETAFSNSLREVMWDISDFHTDALKALFANCPALRSFGSNCLTLDEYNAILQNGKIQELFICGSDILTDAHVLSLVKHLPLLSLLAVQKCKFLTDATLQHIAEYIGSQLKKLYVDIKHPESAETEAILEIFGQKCTKLEHLEIDCGDKVLCQGKGTSLLVRGCPQLKELWVNEVSTITASSRDLIAHFRPNLRICVDTL